MIGVTLLGGTGLYLGILGCWCVPDSHVLFSRYDKKKRLYCMDKEKV